MTIIDTSSWVALVRYYLPFDSNNILPDLIQQKIKDGDIIFLKEVYDECKFQSKGIAITQLPFLADKSLHTKTTELIPSPKFYNCLENQYSVQSQKRQLSDVQFENRKQTYLNSADAKILLKSIDLKRSGGDGLTIVTEETTTNNDLKVFKKIPVIASYLGVRCITMPELISDYNKEVGLNVTKTSNNGQSSLF